MKKILIISLEVWRDDQNTGNVLSNIFQGTDYQFAQIYCSPGIPSNDLCTEYFQMTDRMALRSIFTGHMGKRVHIRGREEGDGISQGGQRGDSSRLPDPENRRFYDFFRKRRLQIFLAAREVLWKLSKWDSKELDRFVDSFQPDYIFAPWYDRNYMLEIDRYVQGRCGCPMISYVTDDNYSFRVIHFSAAYWISRFFLRSNARKTISLCDKVFTMTKEQMEEYAPQFPCKMQILKKSGIFPDVFVPKAAGSPIRIIYAGGIYLNRWKILAKIAESLARINADGVKMQLHIFTNNPLDRRQRKCLHDKKNVYLHQAVSLEILQKEYRKSDLALHAESFDLVSRSYTRLSFSTKIVDCLQSGCAVLAVCPPENAGYRYLKREHAAICVDKISAIERTLRRILDHPELLAHYAHKAWECGRRNHMPEHNAKIIRSTFGECALNRVKGVKDAGGSYADACSTD